MTIESEYHRLRALADAATHGPFYWDSDPVKGDPLQRQRARVVAAGRTITESYYSDDQGAKDSAFITAAHDMMALIEKLMAERNAK